MLALWKVGITGLCPVTPVRPLSLNPYRIRMDWTSSALYPHSSQPVDKSYPMWANTPRKRSGAA